MSSADHAGPGPHPFFDDKRAVAWYRSLEVARLEAARTARRLLVVVGGPRCGGTRSLVERSLSKQEIGEFVGEHFVAVALDPAELADDVAELLARLPRREPTPVCIYLSPGGEVVHSTVGGRPPAVLLADMLEATRRR